MLTVEDEHAREGLAVAIGRSMPAKRVKEILTELFGERGIPEYLRSDNYVPEFITVELTESLVEQGAKTHYIDSGSPWQNVHGESFKRCDGNA